MNPTSRAPSSEGDHLLAFFCLLAGMWLVHHYGHGLDFYRTLSSVAVYLSSSVPAHCRDDSVSVVAAFAFSTLHYLDRRVLASVTGLVAVSRSSFHV